MSTGLKRTGSPQDGEESSTRSRKLVEVVADGDVLLKVGQGSDALEIRVSGTVISLASEVFSRMLSSSFTEGRSKEIELREDDPQVVLDFCNIVHHKVKDLDHCDGSRLLKLAELADARFCVKALRPWVVTRLAGVLETFKDKQRDFTAIYKNRILRKNSLELDMEQCIGLAAIFRLDDLFWFATRHMLLPWSRSPCTRNPRIPPFADPALRSGQFSLRKILIKVREERLSSFLDDIFQCVGEDFEMGPFDYDTPSTLVDRACSFIKYSAFMLYLAWKGSKPGQAGKYRKSISQAMGEVRRLSVQTMLPPWNKVLKSETCTTTYFPPCFFCRRDIAADLLQVVEEHLDKAQGVCLVCFTSGREVYFHATRNHEKHQG